MKRTSMLAHRTLLALASLPALLGACASDGGHADSEETRSASEPLTIIRPVYYSLAFGTAATLASTPLPGFAYGIPDGSLGAVSTGTNSYTFFGAGALPCTGTGCVPQGSAFTMTGSLGTVTSASTTPLFGPGAAVSAGATGWVFDRNYAGGGQVIPVTNQYFEYELNGAVLHYTYSGYMMPYHAEYWPGGDTDGVHTYYGGIGLAVGDSLSSFESAGQIIQVQQSLSGWSNPPAGTTIHNVGGGYGSMVLADENGNHLANPPPAASMATAYFYLFYQDTDPSPAPYANGAGDGNPALCTHFCLAVARASYNDVIATVTPPTISARRQSNPTYVASLFKKYYNPSGTAATWTQKGASGDPSENTGSGNFTALMTDVGGAMASVLYDSVLGEYLMAFSASSGADQTLDNQGICIRSSTDLIHWSPSSAPGAAPACLTFYQPSPSPAGINPTYVYPTLIGETGDPLTGGSAPLVFFENFDATGNDPDSDVFPSWSGSRLQSVPVVLTPHYFVLGLPPL